MFKMKDPKTVILEPDEYKTGADVRAFGIAFIPRKAILITKDNENKVVPTVLNVDPNCRIRVTRSGNGAARVKHLSTTPRRRYYQFTVWFSLILCAIGWILTLYEILVNGNYATEGSPTGLVMLPAMTSWLGLNISNMRNGRGFTKWSVTILGYFILFMGVLSLVRYFAGWY